MPMLTDAAIRRYKPAAARRRVRDAGARSLFLVIEPSGFKAFEMRFRRPGGRIAKMRLGPWFSGRETEEAPQVSAPLTLAAARALAAQVLREKAAGGDPIGAHKARRSAAHADAVEAGQNCYGIAAREYVDEYTRKKNRNWRDAARLLGLDYPQAGGEPAIVRGGLAERWRDRPVREIDGHAVWSVVDEARRIGSPGLGVRTSGNSDARGRLLFVALSGLFSWLLRQRRIDANPCRGIAQPAAGVSRDRVLTGEEIKLVWRAADEAGGPQGAIVKLLLLTGARLNEAAGMRRTELSEDNATSGCCPAAAQRMEGRTSFHSPRWRARSSRAWRRSRANTSFRPTAAPPSAAGRGPRIASTRPCAGSAAPTSRPGGSTTCGEPPSPTWRSSGSGRT